MRREFTDGTLDASVTRNLTLQSKRHNLVGRARRQPMTFCPYILGEFGWYGGEAGKRGSGDRGGDR